MKHIKKLSALLMCALIALSACITASAALGDDDALIEANETGKLTIHLYEALEPYLSQAKTNADGSTTTVTNENFKQVADGGKVIITRINGTSYSSNDTVEGGIAEFNDLPVGEYEVTFEASTFPSTVQSYLQNYKFNVKVPTTKANGTGFNFDVHVYPKIQAVYGILTFTKKDGNGGILQGVTFGVFTDSACKTPLTNEKLTNDGKITTGSGGTFTLTLAPGKYYLKELATVNGYILNSKVIEVEIDGNHKVVDNKGYTYTTSELTNYKNNSKISKEVNDTTVYVGQIVTYTVNVTLPKGIQAGDSLVITDNLPAGLTGQSCTVYGVKSGGSEEKIQPSVPSVPNKYVLTFDNNSSTKVAKLADYIAVKVVITAKVNANNASLLNSGITNTARFAYKPLYGVEISGDASAAIKTGSVLIKKTTSDGSGNVRQAIFKLYTDQACQNLVTFYTDSALTKPATEASPAENGNLTFYGLAPGTTYYVLETQAPTGYELYGKAIEVTAVEGTDNEADTIQNEAKVELPFTGGVGAEVVVASGVLMMVAACFVLKKRVK